MPHSVQNVNKVNSGTCPHGLAPGACPVCSKMGGGGGRVGERPQKPGEMSYHQCAMIGAMMFLKGIWKKPGVWNVEEFDPDPFMEQLNKQGLPWHEVFDGDLEL